MATDAGFKIEPGPRPASLAATLPDSELKKRLLACRGGTFQSSVFSIAHRGAPLGYPEHTREGYIAAARMGAGVIECDVTFTKDGALVCRHSQCDLHRTTNILTTALAQKCTVPFTPAGDGQPADAKCCTTDITLAEFKNLCGRRDVVDPTAADVDTYLRDPATPVTATPMRCATLVTHAESIRLIDELGANFIPELKFPEVPMPHLGMNQAAYASRMLAEYQSAAIDPARVMPQSFHLQDLEHWIDEHPEFADNAVYLDARGRQAGFKPTLAGMRRLREAGINIVAPPMPILLVLDAQGELQASDYARFARQAGLEIVTWTFESGSAADPNNWLYSNLPGFIDHESRMLEVLHALRTKVGIKGIFSDWPGTVTYYANCFDL